MPKISVIIPVYNVAPYLRECLDSIVQQTLQDLEIICVNDGSTDESLTILNEYAEKDSRFIVMSQENKGQSAARNVGLTIAFGEYVYFMDSDDLIDLNCLEVLYRTAEKDQLDIVYFNADAFFESEEVRKNNTNYVTYYERKKSYPEVRTGIELLRAMDKYGDYRPSPCLQFIKMSHIRKNNIDFFEGIIHEDNLFSFKCIVPANRVVHIENVFFHRRVRGASTMTKKKSAKNVIGYFTCFIEMMQYCLENKIEDPILQKTITLVFRNAKNTYKDLSQDEKKNVVWQQPSYENFLFELLIKNEDKHVEGEYTPERYIALQNQLSNIYQSESYRIGMSITYIPRKMKFVFNYYKEHGLSYTLSKIKEKIFK